MADVKISGLPASTTPLAGTEVLPIVQGGQTRQVSVANLTAGRAVSATNLTLTGVATVPAGTVSAPSITTTGDTNTGVFFPAADTIAFTEGGVEAMRIHSSTGVSIGNTTNPGATNLSVTGSTTSSTLIANGALTSSFSIGNRIAPTANATVTGFLSGSYVIPTTVAGAFTLPQMYGVYCDTITPGASSTISSYITFRTASQPNVTQAIGFLSDIASGATNYAFYGRGTAQSYFGGTVTSAGTISPQQATTAGAPAYVKGAIYFDTTLNKLRVGGAAGWETITSV